jgi:two-component sensor histidine kinase
MNAVSPIPARHPQAPWNEMERLAALGRYDILDTPHEADFDDIVRLAAQTLHAPIAVVNLIAAGRQWFKAEIGIGARELPLDVSLCAHAILQNDTMVIPDTREDDRFTHNPLVTADNGLRFYAGALLKTPEGLPIGTVCVLDRQPRPNGISDHQRLTLEILARLVMKQLEMRRVIGLQAAHAEQLAIETRERGLAEESRRRADDRYRSLFNSLDTGFCIIEMAFDEAGRGRDYRFIETNPAFVRQTGLVDAAGKWISDLVPGHQQHWFDTYGQVAMSGEPARFENAADGLGHWFDIQAFRVGTVDTRHVAVLYTDITERRRADIRRDALLAIGDRLRTVNTIADVTRCAAAIVGETLGVTRTGFGRVDATGEFIDIAADWCADEAVSFEGRHRLPDFGTIGETLGKGHPVVLADTRSAPSTAVADALEALGIRAMANVPVQDHNGDISVFFAHSDRPRTWQEDDLTLLRNVGDRVAADVARLEAEALQQVLNLELSHRMKNTLAMVQAVAKQTLRSVPDQGPVEAFRSRLQAMSSAHEALLQQSWASAKMLDIVKSVVGAIENIDRFVIEGPSLQIGPRATLSLSLLLHELSTNALKYGSLSQPGGTVRIAWSIKDEELTLNWRELGGPVVQTPSGKGFGSRLIGMGLMGTGGVDLRYLPAGFEADFKALLSQVEQL